MIKMHTKILIHHPNRIRALYFSQRNRHDIAKQKRSGAAAGTIPQPKYPPPARFMPSLEIVLTNHPY